MTYAQQHYQKNRQYYLDKAKRNKARQRKKIRLLIRDAKNVPCADCNKSYPYYVMQFDHIGDDKSFDIANSVGVGMSIKKVIDEIKKCDVVCANCHAIRTHNRKGESKKREEFQGPYNLKLPLDTD